MDLYGSFKLSIQTHPDICVNYFCETALCYDNKLIYVLEYYDVKRWASPEDLFNHIASLYDKVKNYKVDKNDDNVVVLTDGTRLRLDNNPYDSDFE